MLSCSLCWERPKESSAVVCRSRTDDEAVVGGLLSDGSMLAIREACSVSLGWASSLLVALLLEIAVSTLPVASEAVFESSCSSVLTIQDGSNGPNVWGCCRRRLFRLMVLCDGIPSLATVLLHLEVSNRPSTMRFHKLGYLTTLRNGYLQVIKET